jgi:23S rRNA (guanine745-N1)-methyltransferase
VTPPLLCPVCRAVLADEGGTLRCAAGHAFDRARAGYVNLALSGKGQAAPSGDTAPMLQARQRFLAAGHYAPLFEQFLAWVDRLAGAEAFTVLDVGCGEGSALAAVAARFPEAHLAGFDASKAACRYAARRLPRASIVLHDVNRRFPYPDDCIDLLLNLFAPRNAAEFGRIVTPSGHLLVVAPQPDHLHGLRRRYGLLDIEPGKVDRLQRQFQAWTLVAQERVRFPLRLSAASANDLIRMGPNAFHETPVVAEPVTTEAAFELFLWRAPALR